MNSSPMTAKSAPDFGVIRPVRCASVTPRGESSRLALDSAEQEESIEASAELIGCLTSKCGAFEGRVESHTTKIDA